jgi:phage nucleotide-binding protein
MPQKAAYTAIVYGPPGSGKSGLVAVAGTKSEGKTLVFDVDRTFVPTAQLLASRGLVDMGKFLVAQVDIKACRLDAKGNPVKGTGTYDDFMGKLSEVTPEFIQQHGIGTLVVDNVSELVRCILADLGVKGKNQGKPAQGDYLTMQYSIYPALRYMKGLGVNVLWTAWEGLNDIVQYDGTMYTQQSPMIQKSITQNICGLCDIVGHIRTYAEQDEQGQEHVTRYVDFRCTAAQFAKNQRDFRQGCRVEDFIEKKEVKEDVNA